MSEFCSQSYEDYYVAFIDILGFSNLVKCSEKKHKLFQSILKVLREFKRLERLQGEPPPDAHSYSFSDNIIIFSKPTPYGLCWLLGLAGNICARLLTFEEGFLTRGGIVRGKLYCEESGRLVFGRGFIDAYKLENKVADYPRVVVSNEMYRCFQELNGKWPIGEFGVYGGEILRRDFDGCYHLNYLTRMPIWTWGPATFAGPEEWLDEIREFITKNLRNNVNNWHLYRKYVWFANYFNAHVAERDFGFKPIEYQRDHPI